MMYQCITDLHKKCCKNKTHWYCYWTLWPWSCNI